MHLSGFGIKAIVAAVALVLVFAWVGVANAQDLMMSNRIAFSELDKREALLVTSSGDDNSAGTLRWAITKNNSAPGRYKIVFRPAAGSDMVIHPRSLLPAIVGPALITGPWFGGANASKVVIDGAPMFDMSIAADADGDAKACPGEDRGYGPNVRSLKNPGLEVVDSHDVVVSGFEIRNFCIGVLSLRSHHVIVSHMKFEGNLGAAAVVLSGDDGKPANETTRNITPGVSHDDIIEDCYFLNNSDTIDIVRGTVNSAVRRNTLVVDGNSLAVPSSGIETNRGADNITIEDNFLSGYAAALQLGSDNLHILRNVLTKNVVALDVNGKGLEIVGNDIHGNRTGIGIHKGKSGNFISRNTIYQNGSDFSACAPGESAGGVCIKSHWTTSAYSVAMNYPNGLWNADTGTACPDKDVECDGAQAAPKLTRAAWGLRGIFGEGSVLTGARKPLILEFYVSPSSGPSDMGEAKQYLGALKLVSGEDGKLNFELPPTHLQTGDALLDGKKEFYVTATATDAETGTTSELSRPIKVRIP